MKAVASAPGKVILIGEHFVVYGEPALVMAINRYIQVCVETRPDPQIYISSNLGISGFFEENKFRTICGGEDTMRILEPIKIAAETTMNLLNEKKGLNIEIISAIPMGVGLGSSGASAVATVAAVSTLLRSPLKKEAIVELSTAAERYVHLNPSGVDQAISTYGGLISYKKGENLSRIQISSKIPIIIGNTCLRRNTGRLVNNVKLMVERFPEVMNPLINIGGKLTPLAIASLKRGDLRELGELMDFNHGLLITLGVSTEVLDQLVYAAKRGGAFGAKLTGAGGGGCMVALSSLDLQEDIARSISESGGLPIIAEKNGRGVHSWILEN